MEATAAPFRRLLWSPAAVLLFSASVVVGGLVFFALPLAGLFYGLFSWIAWRGPESSR